MAAGSMQGAVPSAPLADWADLLARIALAAIFLWSGVDKFVQADVNIAYMNAYHVPMAGALVLVSGAFEVGAGAMLAAGWKARWAALALAAFSVFVALIFHAFWSAPAEQALNQAVHFMKNVAMAGGLLHVFAHGAGRYALEKSR